MKRWSISLAMLFLAILVGTSQVTAAPPQVATGTFGIPQQTIVDIQVAGGNIIVTADEVAAVSGDFEGTLTVTTRYVFHPSGHFNLHSEGTFTGTVLDSDVGTTSFTSTGGGEWTLVNGNPTPVTFQGRSVTVGIEGGLLGLSGHGTFDAPHYTVYIHNAP
jgi:hypothetical protein